VVFAAMRSNGYIPTHWRRRSAALAAVAAVAIAALALVKLDPGALRALPALVLPLLLALRRYPGERMLAVLSKARRRRRRPPRSSMPRAARPEVGLPRGGLLLARSLAVRPPPSASLAAS
jgi:hypothetical protein